MNNSIFKIQSNVQIARDIYEMILQGDASHITAPGQFVNIKLDGFYLRRPISVCDWSEGSLTLVYKTVGGGTESMAKLENGAELELLTGLGNGYTIFHEHKSALLLGGGVGVPPLYGLAKKLRGEEKKVTVILGFQNSADVFYTEQFCALGCDIYVSTADGSFGCKGFVTDALKKAAPEYDYYYTCGPEPMLRAVYAACGVNGQLSFEERMGCGFGACMGCTCKTVTGYKRICKDGPVLTGSEILWQQAAAEK